MCGICIVYVLMNDLIRLAFILPYGPPFGQNTFTKFPIFKCQSFKNKKMRINVMVSRTYTKAALYGDHK